MKVMDLRQHLTHDGRARLRMAAAVTAEADIPEHRSQIDPWAVIAVLNRLDEVDPAHAS